MKFPLLRSLAGGPLEKGRSQRVTGPFFHYIYSMERDDVGGQLRCGDGISPENRRRSGSPQGSFAKKQRIS
jgi:hypothetical protein